MSYLIVTLLLFWFSSGAVGSNLSFPDNFAFGVATSAYQIEGAWNVSDKGMNVWDNQARHKPFRDNADVACNSYYLYQTDVKLCKGLNVDFYRFSISWSRLLPTGFSDHISRDGLRYYNALIDELIAANIEPVVTLFHFDLPQSLQDFGGVANPLFETWFADYVAVAFDKFGDRVKIWLTINEPQIYCVYSYSGIVHFPPGIDSPGIGVYLCAHNLIKAHAKAYHLYDERFRKIQKGRVSLVAQILWPEALTDVDEQVAYNMLEWMVGVFIDPIFSKNGDYSSHIKQLIANKSQEQGYPRSRLPELSKSEIDYIKGTYDFLGLNYYSKWPVSKINPEIYSPRKPSWPDDGGAMIDCVYDLLHIDEVDEIDPTALRKLLNFLSKRYNHPEIMIFENGLDSARIEDDDRVKYLRSHGEEILKAIHHDKCNVTRYTVWSLMDNFEWNTGYGSKYGLFEVDFTDPMRKRKPRKSAFVYKKMIEQRKIDWHYNPQLFHANNYFLTGNG